jgi:hypothetical protein
VTALPERFWAKVIKTETCWLWQASKNRKGYGLFGLGRTRIAHRIAFEDAYGQSAAGKVVMHTCDTPACVNPAHLRLGTPLDNARDSAAKGRRACFAGERNGQAKVSNATRDEIREKYVGLPRSPGGRPVRGAVAELVKRYGITHQRMWQIARGRSH